MTTEMETPTERDIEAARRLAPLYIDAGLLGDVAMMTDGDLRSLACMLQKYRTDGES